MRFPRLRNAIILAISSTLAPSLSQAGQIEFFTVGSSNPSAGYYAGTVGLSVSDTGVVAATANLGHSSESGAVYDSDTQTVTNLPVSGRLLAISADGSRAVGFGNANGGAISWEVGSGVNNLANQPGYTQAAAISPDGNYVAGVGGSPSQMASWNFDGSAGALLNNLDGSSFGWAGAVANNGLVGGTSGDSARAAAIGTAGMPGTTVQLGQGYLDATIPNPYGKVMGISSDGTILVGESLAQTGNSGSDIHMRAFIVNNLVADDTLVALATPTGWESAAARDVTDRLFSGSGIAVGNVWNGDKGSPTDQAAAIWVPGSGADLLQNYATNVLGITVPAGYTLLTAFGISTDGLYITGSARDASGNQVGYVLYTGSNNNPVPEPASVITLAIGGVMTAVARRRRKSLPV